MTPLIGEPVREAPNARMLISVLAAIVLAFEFGAGSQSKAEYAKHVEYVRTYERMINARTDAPFDYEKAQATYDASTLAFERHSVEYCTDLTISLAFAVLLFLLYPAIMDGNRASVGLSLTPRQGWRVWLVGFPLVAAVVGILAIPGFWVWWLMGGRPEDWLNFDWKYPGVGLDLGVRAPFAEEVIYRMGICVPVVAWVGPRTAIVVSGVLFALMHVVCGAANPVCLISGFVLAWAFLKSNTILVPMLLHAVGNFGTWYVATIFVLPHFRTVP